jgi:hypothetical protein
MVRGILAGLAGGLVAPWVMYEFTGGAGQELVGVFGNDRRIPDAFDAVVN